MKSSADSTVSAPQTGPWTLYRHAEVRAVLSDPCFVVPPPPKLRAGADDDAVGGLDWLRRSVSRFSTGPQHDRRRGIVLGELARLDPVGLRHAAHEATTAVLGQVGRKPFDVMSRLARAVPLGVLGAELDVAPNDLDTLVSATAAVAAAYHPGATRQVQDLADAAVPTLLGLMGSDLTDWPGGSGWSRGSGWPGGSDADLEAVANRIGLLVQACDATAGLIGNAIHAALRLSADPLAEWSIVDIIAETLRFEPPVRSTRRQSIAGARWAGELLPIGTIVVLDFAAANRDAAGVVDQHRTDQHHDDPHRFDPGRAAAWQPQESPGWAAPGHLTFGYGLRPCPGSDHGLALACGVVEAVLAVCELADSTAAVSYQLPTNLRVPTSLECRIR